MESFFAKKGNKGGIELRWQNVLDLLPIRFSSCLLCPQMPERGSSLCATCLDGLPRLGEPPPELTQIWSQVEIPFLYRSPIDDFIRQLKFHHQLHLSRLLGNLLADFLEQQIQKTDFQPPEMIIPVPLHKSRLRERGFNQSLEIAKPVMRRLGIPLQRTLCQRVRATSAQSGLELEARKRNLHGAFAVSKPLHGETIALVDDVVTTGSTLLALSDVLKQAGAGEIQVWAVAWTPPTAE